MIWTPAHHDPNGGFQNIWPGSNGGRTLGDLLRWQWQRMRSGVPSRPAGNAIARRQPDIVYPAARPEELRITWIGHSTFLIQIAGKNVLTDPVWSERASPFQWLGPVRFSPPGVPFEALPRIDAVLLSHDHYDHLDTPTVRRIAAAHPSACWLAPLEHSAVLRQQGITTVIELDWWQTPAQSSELLDRLRFTALPAQHWTNRLGSRPYARLWCSWSIAAEGMRVYFAGDSGYCPVFHEIGERLGPFDAALLPIGAYEPRWFMQAAHMNPEEAVQVFHDLGARHFFAMHWSTFQLTDEDPLEPPLRLRAEWERRALPLDCLHIPAIGETILVGVPVQGR